MRPSLIDQLGPRPILHSWGYVEAYLKQPHWDVPEPQLRARYCPGNGLWLPLSAVPAVVNDDGDYAETMSGGGFKDVTLSPTATTGNAMIVATGSYFATGNVTGVTDSASNTYTSDFDVSFTLGRVEIWSCLNLTGSPTYVRITGTVSEYFVFNVTEVSGLLTSAGGVDKTASADSQTATYSSGATATLSQANEFCLGVNHISPLNTATWTPDSPWVQQRNQHGASYQSLQTQYKVVSSSTGLAETGTGGPTGGHSIIATYKSAAAAGRTTKNIHLRPLGLNLGIGKRM